MKIRSLMQIAVVSFASLLVLPTAANENNNDPFLWLEEVEGEKALAWVNQQNDHALATLKAHPKYADLYNNALSILNDKTRIPYVSQRGDYLYNFWKDDVNPRGIYRRTNKDEYKKASPQWEVIFDLDAIAKNENENWVYKGIDCLYPEYRRCLLSLSRGGADATVVREFDIESKQFVSDGYYLPEAKSSVSWIDENRVFVGTDFGDNSLTDSGYPRIAKVWQRGTPVTEAVTLYSADKTSVAAGGYTVRDGEQRYQVIYDMLTFYTSASFLADVKTQQLQQLAIPADASVRGIYNGQLFVELKSDWQNFKQGDIVYTAIADATKKDAQFSRLFTPTESISLSSMTFTQSAILLTVMDNVKDKLYRYQLDDKKQWQISAFDFDANGSLSVMNASQESDDFFVQYTSFLDPATLYQVSAQDLSIEKLKSAPAFFAADKYQTAQHFAVSKDGTKVPYFLVMAKDVKLDGKNPTLLYGYGGFEVALQPYYSATMGKNWLDQGGVYVLANIRGGGEYGPRWHQAALKHNRHKAYEDFEAVAEDLIKRKVTASKHLGIQGGSNGGLLMGAAFTRRPDLYNAVVCQVPLLDMQRFNKLLAGASWMGEYGDPDKAEDWAYIKTYSPYHNLDKATAYPKVFFTTSTRDDRVHPGHARKMVAKMKAMGHDVLYFENTEGGHAGAANNEQRAMVSSLTYAYLLERLSAK